MVEPKTHTLNVPGATLRYDIRDPETETDAPVLFMVGSPMSAAGFTTLAGHFGDRTVVTYDPRGIGRSELTDGATQTTPVERADDVHRLIAELDAGQVDVFGSSGGAVDGLVLVASTRSRCARWSRTSRPQRPRSRIASRRSPPWPTSARPMSATGSGRRWRSSSP
jgi:pimeloyl-ACP methyl ester carboxylesterase